MALKQKYLHYFQRVDTTTLKHKTEFTNHDKVQLEEVNI